MAHTKAQKATKGNRDSRPKMLGVKAYGGEAVKSGYVIIRQRGTNVKAGQGTLLGRDDTITALCDGKVRFYQKQGKQFVSVI